MDINRIPPEELGKGSSIVLERCEDRTGYVLEDRNRGSRNDRRKTTKKANPPSWSFPTVLSVLTPE